MQPPFELAESQEDTSHQLQSLKAAMVQTAKQTQSSKHKCVCADTAANRLASRGTCVTAVVVVESCQVRAAKVQTAEQNILTKHRCVTVVLTLQHLVELAEVKEDV